MAFGNFRETSEDTEKNENMEDSVENTDRPRNQILATSLDESEDYDDDLDDKLDAIEDSEQQEIEQPQEIEEEGGREDGDDRDEGEEGQGLFARLKGLLSKERTEQLEENEETEEHISPEKSANQNFRDSLKSDMSPEEVAEYDKAHGQSPQMERPSGGWERALGGDVYDDGSSNEVNSETGSDSGNDDGDSSGDGGGEGED